MESYGYNKWQMEENWQNLQIESKNCKGLFLWGRVRFVFFLHFHRHVCEILVKVTKFLSQNLSKKKKPFLDSFQSVGNYCFGQLKVFARQCPFSNMREWSVLSFEDSIFIIGQEVLPVRMLFLKTVLLRFLYSIFFLISYFSFIADTFHRSQSFILQESRVLGKTMQLFH